MLHVLFFLRCVTEMWEVVPGCWLYLPASPPAQCSLFSTVTSWRGRSGENRVSQKCFACRLDRQIESHPTSSLTNSIAPVARRKQTSSSRCFFARYHMRIMSGLSSCQHTLTLYRDRKKSWQGLGSLALHSSSGASRLLHLYQPSKQTAHYD